jgi:hypothetical protein
MRLYRLTALGAGWLAVVFALCTLAWVFFGDAFALPAR